ncbi:MAG: efflux RND transporter periplasmic adaptor subunit [Cyclobacteriaceae bacterium]|nr:efflux RND transporter periplasmic adaptor subunit [Cyclobacteriaceae bacterium]
MNRVIVITLAIGLGFGCSEKKSTVTAVGLPDSVEVFKLNKEQVAKILSLPGELHPWERAELYAKVEGYVKEVKADIGDRVKQNDILLVLDAPEVTANFAKASADLQAAQSTYHTSRDTYRRVVIASKEKGAVSENELERVRNQMLSDSASWEAAKSGANAYAQLRNYLVIRSPFGGVVTQRHVDAGTLVGNSSQRMMQVENLDKLRLRVAVPEAYSAALPETSSVNFEVDAQPGKIYSAVLSRKSNQIDLKTRTELWEFEVNNPKQELKSGMYGNVNFALQRSEPSFVVPFSALVTNLERKFVIRVRDGKTEWVNVRSGITMNDKVEVFGDIQEGDTLVLRANDELKSGVVVTTK